VEVGSRETFQRDVEFCLGEQRRQTTMSLHEANNTMMPSANQLHALLLDATSDLIRASDLGELSRVTFDHVSSALDADVCTNYRLDSTGQCLKLEFGCGLPPEKLEMARLIKLGQEYCGRAAATRQPLVADRQRIASDPNGGLVRELGATAYACYPLKASGGRLLGTFAVASARREGFTNDDVVWLGTITNFLSQAWERFETEQGLRTSEERLHQSFSKLIAERVGVERALAESEARFRASFENAAVGIAHVTNDGRYLHVNEALCRFLGYPADELVTKSFQDVTHPEDIASDLQCIEQMREGKIDHYDIEKRYLRKDGAIVWGRKTVGCLRKSDGSIDYLISTVEDICKRKRAVEELRKSEERFKSSVLFSPLPVLLYDDREQILAVSESWMSESGYSNEDLHRLEDWTACAFGERSSQVLDQMRHIISGGPAGSQPDERVIRTKDGRERLWSFVYSSPGTESDGRRLFVCVAQDVTERKAREERIHLLMREVNHRDKNILSLVQAIAHQTAAREPGNFIACFVDRLQALAVNQDLLVQNQWNGVEIEDLVRSQLAPFAGIVGIGSHVAMHGPNLRLKAASAQAIGLALHELATNAGKYGALTTDTGWVEICWRVEGGIFTMSWTEREGPPVCPPKRHGFGTTVIVSMVERSLSGAVDLDFAASGVTWHLACPALNALEPRI
jgi:PAS domain S-box-containing protein